MRAKTPPQILITAINYAPELTGIGKFVGEMAEWLAAQGLEVTVVTAPPYYPTWSVAPGYRAWAYRREFRAGVTVHRCPVWVPSKPTGLTRLLHLASFAIASLPVLLFAALVRRPRLIFTVEPPLFCAPGALLAAVLPGTMSWLHVQDFEVDAAFDLGLLSSGRLKSGVLAFERWLMRRFDRVTTISSSMVRRLGDKGCAVSGGSLFPNWVDTDQIRPEERSVSLQTDLGIPAAARVLLYSGAMGQKQGLELLIDAARELIDEADLVFVLCGDGSARVHLEEMAGGLHNVAFRPLQPFDRLNELLNLATIHLLPQRADAQDLVMPSKLTAMLASGRPVIATARPDSEIGAVVGQCGIVVPPGDAAALVGAIRMLLADPESQRSLGEAGRQYALQHWRREVVLRRAFQEFLPES